MASQPITTDNPCAYIESHGRYLDDDCESVTDVKLMMVTVALRGFRFTYCK